MTRSLVVSVVAALALAFVVGACIGNSDDADDPPLAVSTTADLGDGWSIGLPEGWDARDPFGDPEDRGDDCVVRVGRIATDPGTIEIALVGAACSSSASNRGNGEPANFSSAEQLANGDELETVTTELGRLTVATVSYYECTNECDEWTPAVGVLELDEPPDPAYPAIMIVNDYGSTHDQVRFLAENLIRR